jgi:putative tricarboxylic transport membrane protein
MGIDLGAASGALLLLSNFALQIVCAIVVGLMIGIIVGAVPGIGTPMAMAAVLPFAFHMQPIVAALLLTAIYTGGVAGGSIASILTNIPGDPASIATCWDGFPMTQQGRHNEALGLSLYSHTAGVTISYVLLFVFLGPASQLSKYLGPADRVAIAFAVLSIVSGLQGKTLLRGLIAALLGLVLGTLNPTQTGIIRSKFLEMPAFFDGLSLIPVVLGLVCLSELVAFVNDGRFFVAAENFVRPSFKRIVFAFPLWLRHKYLMLASSVLGTLVGIAPAAGSSIAGILAYSQAKAWSKNADQFGKGAPEGIVATDTSASASEGGAILPMLALGIPGSGAGAVLMSGLFIFGFQLGPVWLAQNLNFAYALVFGHFVTSVLLFVLLGLTMARMANVIYVPFKFTAPLLAVISTVGVYALNLSLYDVALLWVLAYVGYVMKKNGYPPIATLLGFILAPTIDAEMYRVIEIYSGRYLGLLVRPVVAISIAIGLAMILSEWLRSRRARKRLQTQGAVDAKS